MGLNPMILRQAQTFAFLFSPWRAPPAAPHPYRASGLVLAPIADTPPYPERANAKGTASIQVGGCDDKISNCLPIMKDWNYTVRLSDLICPVRLIPQSATGEQHFDQEGDKGAHCEKQRQTKGHE